MSRGIKWTKREETYVIGWKSAFKNKGFQELADDMYEAFGNRRSAHAVKMKWKKLQETHAISEETETPTFSLEWDEEKDFFLLVNFYDMTIDGLRAHFKCSYAECAGRLEYLIDSAEVSHIALVKKAAMTVMELRRQRIPMNGVSRKERRLIDRIDKLNSQLMKLRGEKNE